MRKRIRYDQLLEMIRKGTQPKKITLLGRYEQKEMRWAVTIYVGKKCLSLIEALFKDYSDAEIANEPLIEYEEAILDAKEREFIESLKCLRLVGATKKEVLNGSEYLLLKTKSRTRRSREEYAAEYTNMPTFPKGTMYKGMELGREYTIEELLDE